MQTDQSRITDQRVAYTDADAAPFGNELAELVIAEVERIHREVDQKEIPGDLDRLSRRSKAAIRLAAEDVYGEYLHTAEALAWMETATLAFVGAVQAARDQVTELASWETRLGFRAGEAAAEFRRAFDLQPDRDLARPHSSASLR